MTNDYKTIEEAEAAWKSKDWAFHRSYFRKIGEAAICKEAERYFIIIHRDCVDYRKKRNQTVKML